MTEQEAKGFIQGKLDCMKKCGIFDKEDNDGYKDCDNCDYCYTQGNFGEQKNAFEMAIKHWKKYSSTGVDNMRKIIKILLVIILAVVLFIAFLTFIVAWSAIG